MFPCFLWSSWRNRHCQIKWLYGNTILLLLFTHLKWSIPKLQWLCRQRIGPNIPRDSLKWGAEFSSPPHKPQKACAVTAIHIAFVRQARFLRTWISDSHCLHFNPPSSISSYGTLDMLLNSSFPLCKTSIAITAWKWGFHSLMPIRLKLRAELQFHVHLMLSIGW